MRTLAGFVIAIAVVSLVFLPSAALGSLVTTSPLEPSGRAHGSAPAVAPALPLIPSSISPWRNTTWAPEATTPSAAPPPISAMQVTPLPRPPPTTPTVMTFLTASQTCCVQANFTAPTGGPWAAVILNYTGQAVGGVYDSSFRAYIDQVQVLFGTTPEYGIWFVSRDVTPYQALFNGTFNFTFLLSAATVGGYFLSSVSLSFYPPVPGTPVPSFPDQVIPLFHRVFVSTTGLTVTTQATVPTNARNATLELWTYGFGPDEFWYATASAYRGLFVAVDGQPLVAQLPFPYINTGGSDLFAWRPITAAFTLDDRPYDFDVSAGLGMLEGTHNFTANLSGVTASSNWLIGGALLIYTSASAGPATLTNYRFSAPPVRLVSNHLTYYNEYNNLSFSYASDVPDSSGPVHIATSTNESFASSLLIDTTNGWNNLTIHETLASSTVYQAPSATLWQNGTIDFPVAMDLGSSFVTTSTTGGGYPIFGNFTSSFLNAAQEWNERRSGSTRNADGSHFDSIATVDNRVTGGVNVFAGTEELTGPNAALLLSITFVESSTTDVFSETIASGAAYFSFQHVLVGTAYQPPGPDDVETVATNMIVSPVVARLSASPSILEEGSSLDLLANAVGGQGPISYTYSGLPSGCVSSNTTVLACSPDVAGIYLVEVVARDAAGMTSIPASTELTVLPPPMAVASTNTSTLDVGGNLYTYADVTGGIGPYTCVWSVDGVGAARQPCDGPFSASSTATGDSNISVVVTDAVGGVSVPAWVTITTLVRPTLLFALSFSGNTLRSGQSAVVSATVAGGLGPYTFAWFLNGTLVPQVTGPTLVLVNLTEGTIQISAQVTDATNVTSFGPGPTITVVAPSPATGGQTPTTDNTPLVTVGGLTLGLGIGVLVGGVVAFLALRARRRFPPSDPAPPGRVQ